MLMKKTWLLAALLCAGPALVGAQSMQEILNDGKNTDNVLTLSMGNDRKSFSPLKEINKSTVKRLVPVWTTSLMNDFGELAAPVLYNGVLYAINGRWTFAIDMETGRQIWRTPVQIEPGSGVTPYGAFPRGAPAIFNGKLFRISQDAHVFALDMKTGKEIWNQRFGEWKDGYNGSGAPIVANGVVLVGMAGGDSTTRGFIDGYDPDTGNRLWRRYTVPAPGEPGSETWPKDSDAWKTGGGATWRSGTYDPELDLVYWGTGNAEPWDPRPREERDSLFTSSVIAIRPKTGEIACYHQYTPNDVYDVDGIDENVLADLTINGQPRKVMIQANKNGFLYVNDRTNCKLIAAYPFTRVNWASSIDLKTGRPVLTDLYRKFLGGEEVAVYPQRGTNATPIAFNPNTGLIYLNSWDRPRIEKLYKDPTPPVMGKSYTLIQSRQIPVKPGEVVGFMTAINPLTGVKKWEIPLQDMANSAGMLATGGGLVFTGKLNGEFIALDEDTGKTVWSFKTSSSVNSTPITYTHKGKQYITVASGLGGLLARGMAAEKVPSGGSLWTFALMPD